MYVSSLREQIEAVVRSWLGMSYPSFELLDIDSGEFRQQTFVAMGKGDRSTGETRVLWICSEGWYELIP